MPSAIEEEVEANRLPAEKGLRELQDSPPKMFWVPYPTDDVYADRLGTLLQRNNVEQVVSLNVNFSGWTQWGSMEINKYIEKSTCLEDVALMYDASEETTLTSSRTLASFLEAIVRNKSMKSLRFEWVNFDGKSLAALCRLLEESTNLTCLCFRKSLAFPSIQDLERVGDAFSGLKSVQVLLFQDVPAASLQVILGRMSLRYPRNLDCLFFSTVDDRSDLETQALIGLKSFLESPTCQLKDLSFARLNIPQESMELLYTGLIGNTSLKILLFYMCSFHEPVLHRILQEIKSVEKLSFDGCYVHNPPAILNSLQTNTSVIDCLLSELHSPCGRDLQNLLVRNGTIRSLKLYRRSNSLVLPDMLPLAVEDMRLLADGVRLNHGLETLDLGQFCLDDTCIRYITEAFSSDSVSSPLDVKLTDNPIEDASLQHFSTALQNPHCRLRKLSLEIGDSPSQRKGLVGVLEALTENRRLDSFECMACFSLDDWECLAKCLAKSLPDMLALKRLELNLPLGDEGRARHINRKRLVSIRSGILEGLKGNKILEQIEFFTGFYQFQTLQDKDFLKRVSFYVMRNQLQKKLLTLDENTPILARLELASGILREELETKRPWNQDKWKVDAERINRLNKLSLEYLALRSMPHQLVSAAGMASL